MPSSSCALRRDIRLATRVQQAAWDAEARRRHVRTGTGEEITCRFYVMATGGPSLPKAIDIADPTRQSGDDRCSIHLPECRLSARRHAVTAFRALLLALWVMLAGYTAIVIANHGIGLLDVFFRDMAAMGWPGQFNLDFTTMLTLSALWVAWRHQFSGAGLVLGVLAFFGGGLFLTTYLLIVTGQSRGDVKEVLLGKARAAG
jgi:hypothetical protein